MTNQINYLIAINQVSGIGISTVKKIVEHFGTPEQAWNASAKEKAAFFGKQNRMIQAIGSDELLHRINMELEWCIENDVTPVSYVDNSYPILLSQCTDAPLVLFTKGKIRFNQGKFISIVGTRNMTSYGKEFIEKLIEDLSGYPLTIVSGLALGCDYTAHQHALKNNLPTIGVLGHGLHRIYPANHKSLAQNMLESGALVTENMTSQPIRPENFIQRNRIIAGMADLTIVIESGYKGGALATAKFANHYNREVMALPGKTTDQFSKGCNHLIRTHQASMIVDAQSVIEYLNLDLKPPKPVQKELFIELDQEEDEIYKFLNQNGKTHIDNLAYELDKPVYILLSTLLNLELKGIIKTLPGKHYEVL